MIKKEYRTMMKKIPFASAKAENDLNIMLDQASDFATERLLKALISNSHKVIAVRKGQSRRDGYKEMIFVDIENLNNQKWMYRVDFIANGKTVEILKGVTDGWKQVSTW